MKKAKKHSNRLMAVLLSMAMILTSILPGITVYANEPTGEAVVSESEQAADGDETLDKNTAGDSASDDGTAEEEVSGTESADGTGSQEGDSQETETGSQDGEDPVGSGSEDEVPGTENSGDAVSDGIEAGEEGEGPSEDEGLSEDEELLEDEGLLEGEELSEDEELSEGEELSEEEAAAKTKTITSNVKVDGFSAVGGWNESIYAEISGVKDTDVSEVSYSGTMNGKLSGDDFKYLVRESGGGVRIDIPGLKAGTYTLTVKVGVSTLTGSDIKVTAYDRSGFAHFDPKSSNHNYSAGVGAYKNDGTLKDNAIILYVTDENKNDVEVQSKDGTKVKGIGNILNSVGQNTGSGKTSNGGTKPNTNNDIIKKLAKDGTPLVVRFIGTVSETELYERGTYNAASEGLIDGLTAYNSTDYGGSVGDNGHMARIQSGKDITLEGIGYDATIDGWGFHYIAQSSDPDLGKSFEVRNLTFINTPEDAVGMEGQQVSANTSSKLSASVEHCWIHNNELYCPHISSPAESDKGEGDGSVDFKRGQYFTCSYNYFDSCHKTNLVGSADTSLQFNLTYHHNYWYMCKARGPLTRNANVHMYNNVFDMQTDYAMNTRANAYIFSEYNMFYACKSPQAVESGAIKSYNDSIASVIWNKGEPGTVVTNKSDYVPNNCQFQAEGIKYDKFDTDSSLSYIPSGNYELQTDFTDLRQVIAAQTGAQERTPMSAGSIGKSEYSVISRYVSSPVDVNINGGSETTLTPGKISKTGYAFKVNGEFDVEIEYDSAAKVSGVLVNDEGANLCSGSGTVTNLPEGSYMIQPETFQPGDPAKGTIAVFKETNVKSIKIAPHDPNKHYHTWELDKDASTAATCTGGGKNVYKCSDPSCDDKAAVKEETVPALGHSYGAWVVDKAATDTEEGSKHRECTRCGDKQTETIPVGGGSGSGTGGTGGGVTVAGDYVLYFEGMKENDPDDFFTVNGSYSNSKGSATIGDKTYTDCLKMESKTEISFECNEGASLELVFASGETGKTVKVDGDECTTDDQAHVKIENLAAGIHKITKKDGINLFYAAVTNPGSEEVYYTLSFEYNYDDSPDAKEAQVLAGTTYESVSAMVPASFTRSGYTLSDLYTDIDCTNKVAYPYTVSGDARFYAVWKEGDKPDVPVYSLIFNEMGGSAVATVRISASDTYVITQRSTREGYVFAGWYDAPEGGNPVTRIIGSELTGNYTVYAHWNLVDKTLLSLDCSKDLEGKGTTPNSKGEFNITSKTEVNGFTIYALEGGVGTAGSENPKYYMTVKDGGLYTNGVRITDTSIQGNEDGLLKVIEFTTEGPGALNVEMALSGQAEAGKTYKLALEKKGADASSKITQNIDTGKTKTTKEFDISEAGTWYLYAEGDKGVVYYSMKFTQPQYTIMWESAHGSGKFDTAVKMAGDSIVLPECTADAGYIFKGWSLDGTTLLEGGAYTVDPDDATGGVITLTAVYDTDPDYIPDVNAGLVIVGLEKEYDYTGAKIVPDIGVVDYNIGKGRLLTAGVDYTVKYKNNVKETKVSGKKAEVIVTGKGNYTGKDAKQTFDIIAAGNATVAEGVDLADLKGAKINKIASVTYNGQAQYPDFELKLKGQSSFVKYVYDNDVSSENYGKYYTVSDGQKTYINANVALSNNKNKGTAAILLTGKKNGAKVTSVKKTFKITPADISSATVEILGNAAAEYSVKGAVLNKEDISVKLAVKVGEESKEIVLRNGTDYTVKYSSNKKASVRGVGAKGTLTIVGKGNFKSKAKPKEFAIEKLDMSKLKVSAVTAYDGIKAGKVKATVLDTQGNILKASQYTVKVYKEGEDQTKTEVGKNDVLKAKDVIYVQAAAKDNNNLTGETSKDGTAFTVGSNISKAKFTLNKDKTINKAAKVYTGSEIRLTNADLKVTVKVKGSKTPKTLTMGTDYEIVEYTNNINKGTAVAVIRGIGDYSGTKTFRFKIVPKNMALEKDGALWDDIEDVFGGIISNIFGSIDT